MKTNNPTSSQVLIDLDSDKVIVISAVYHRISEFQLNYQYELKDVQL